MIDVLHRSGWMMKRGEWNTALKRRWFVMNAGFLYYFDSDQVSHTTPFNPMCTKPKTPFNPSCDTRLFLRRLPCAGA